MRPSHVLAFCLIVLGAACGDATGPKAPIVSAVNPDRGPLAGGTSVTITGSNFSDITGVTFGGTALVNVTTVSSTKITAVTAAGQATGAQEVVVTSSRGGSGHCANCFTFTQFPGPLELRLLMNQDSTRPLGALLIRIEGGPISAIQAVGPAVPWSSTTLPAHLIVAGDLNPGAFLATIVVPDTQEAVRTRYYTTVRQASARRSSRYVQLNAGDFFVNITRVVP